LKKILKILVSLAVILAVVFGVLRVMCFIYPNDYKLTVEKCAKMYGISPSVIYGVIKAESDFDESAVSKKGAVGLMQIMEPTGAWAAEKLDISGDLKKGETNIEIGSFYLSYLLDLYENDLDCALAAYNAGSANVDKWLSDKKYSDDGKTLKEIPFKETAGYVKKVRRNMKIYDFLY